MVSHALPFMDTPMQSIEELTIKLLLEIYLLLVPNIQVF
jgi:hypothetical protein